MSYLLVGLGSFIAGCVMGALSQHKVVAAAQREADALRRIVGVLESKANGYEKQAGDLLAALKAKL